MPYDSNGNWTVPTTSGPTTSNVGDPRGGGRLHEGVDKDGYIGEPIPWDLDEEGEVVNAETRKGYGNIVVIRTPSGKERSYAHLNKYHVKPGDKVKKGQVFAEIGNTGAVRRGKGGDGSHLHYEEKDRAAEAAEIAKKYGGRLAQASPQPAAAPASTETAEAIAARYGGKVAPEAPAPTPTAQPVPTPTYKGTKEGELDSTGTYKWQNGTWVYGNGLLPSQQQGAIVDPQKLVVDPNNPQQGPPQQQVNIETGLQEAGSGAAPTSNSGAPPDFKGDREAEKAWWAAYRPAAGDPLRDAGVNGYMPPSPTQPDGNIGLNQYLAGQLVRPQDHESPLGSGTVYFNSHPDAIKKVLDPQEQASMRALINEGAGTPEEKAVSIQKLEEAEKWAAEQGGFKDRENQGVLSGVTDPSLRASMEAKLASGEAFTPEETAAATAAAAKMQGLEGGEGGGSVAEALAFGSPLNADGTYNEDYDRRALERYSKERDPEEEARAAKYEQWRAQRQFAIQFSGEGADADLTLAQANARLRDFVFNTKGDLAAAEAMNAEATRRGAYGGAELGPDGKPILVDGKGYRDTKAAPGGVQVYNKETGKPFASEAEWQEYRDRNAQSVEGNPQRTISVFADEDLIRLRNAWGGEAYEAQLQKLLDDPKETEKNPEVQARRAKWLATSKALRMASGPDSRTGMPALDYVQRHYDSLTPRQKAIYDTGEDPGPDASQMSDRGYASIGTEAGLDLLGRAWDATLGANWYGEADILPKPTNHMEHMIRDAMRIQMDTPLSNTFANFIGTNYTDEQYKNLKFHKDKNGKLVVDSGVYDGGFKPVTAISDAFTQLYGMGRGGGVTVEGVGSTNIGQEAYQQISTFTSALLDSALGDYDPRYDRAFNSLSQDQQQAFMEWRAGRHQLASTLGSTANLIGSTALAGAGMGELEALSIAAKAGKLKTFLQGTSALLAKGGGVGRSLVEATVLSAAQQAREMGAPTLDEWAAGGGWNEYATYGENVINYFKGTGQRIPSNFNQFQGGRYFESVAEQWAMTYGLKGLRAAAAGRIGEAFGEVAPETIEQIITQKQDWEALKVNALYGLLLGRKAGHGGQFIRSSHTGITYTVDPNTGVWKVAPESGFGAPGKNDLVLPSAAVLGPEVDFDGAINRLMGINGQARSSVAPKGGVQTLGLGQQAPVDAQAAEDQTVLDASAAELAHQQAAGDHSTYTPPPQSIFASDTALREAGDRSAQIEEHLSTQGPDEVVGAVAERAAAFTKLADAVETGLLGKKGEAGTGTLGLDGTTDIPAAKTREEQAKVLTDALVEASRLPDGELDPALLSTLGQKVAELREKDPKEIVKALRDVVKEEQERVDATQKEFAAPDKQRERYHRELANASTAVDLHTQERDAAKADAKPLVSEHLKLQQQAARANLEVENAKTAQEEAANRYRDAIESGTTGGALQPIREAHEVAEANLAYAEQQQKAVASKLADSAKAVKSSERRYTKAEIAVAKAEQRRENALSKLEDFHQQQLEAKEKAKKEKEEKEAAEAAPKPKAPTPAPKPAPAAPTSPASPTPTPAPVSPNTPASPAAETAPKSEAVAAPAKGRTVKVTVEGEEREVELNEAQAKEWDKAEAQYKAELAHADNPVMDKTDAAKRKKAAGFRFAAQKRLITDQLTAKERQHQQQDAAKINVGKKVTVQEGGKTLEGTVATNPVYGRVGVLIDGEQSPRNFLYGDVSLAGKELHSTEPTTTATTPATAKEQAARAAILADPEQVAKLTKAAVTAINAVTADKRVKEDSKGASIALDGSKVTTGYAVAIDPQFEHVIPAGTDESAGITAYLQRPDVQEELAKRTNGVFGMWRNPELDNALTLDISEIWSDKAKAVQEGIARKQWGIFDIETSLELGEDGDFKSGFIPLDAGAEERTLNSTEYGGGKLSPTSTSILDSPEGRRRYLDESGNLAQIADAALTYLDAAGGKPAVVALSGIDMQEGYAVPANLEQGFSNNSDEATSLIQYLIRPDVVKELSIPGTALAVWRDGSGMRANVVYADSSKREAVSFGEVNGHIGLFDISTGEYTKLEIGAIVKSLTPVIEEKYRQLGIAVDGKPLAHVRAQIVKNVMETFGVSPQQAIDILWEEGLFGINVHNVVRMESGRDADGNPIYNDVEVKRLSDGSIMLAQRSTSINLFESNVVGEPEIKKGILADIEKDLRKIVREYNRNSTNAQKRKEILAAIDEALKPYVKAHKGAQSAAVARVRKASDHELTKEEVDAIRQQIPPTEVEEVRARLAKELELDQFPEMTLDDLAPQREAMTERARLDALNKLEDIIKALNKQTKKKFQPFDMKGPRATKAQRHRVWAKKAATRFADDMMIDLESFFDDFVNHADKFRDIDRNLLTPETAKALINRAFFWYTEGVKVATAHAARAFPELGVDKHGQPKDKFATMAFHTLLGMHSPGTDPASNSVAAVNHYYEWTKLRREAVARGENPDKILLPMVDEAAFVRVPGKIEGREFEVEVPGGAFSRAGHNTVIALNALATHKFNGNIKLAMEWLHQEHPIAEIREAASYSKQSKLDLPDTPTAIGSLIFGAKVGAFVANVHGNLDYLTADLWFTRSWNRGMGTLQIPPKSGSTIGSEPRHEDERRAMRLGTLEVAKRLEEQWKSATKMGKLMREVLGTPKTVSMAEAQSILWYMEQQIWARQGGLPRSQSFEEGTKNYTDNWAEKAKEREETRKAVHAAMLSSYYYETTPERRQVATGEKSQPAGDVRNYSASPDLLSNLATVDSLLAGYEVMKAKPGLPQKPKLVDGKYHIIRTGEDSALPENIFDTKEEAEGRLDDLREYRSEFNQGPVRYEALLIQKRRITEALMANTGLTMDQINAESLVRVHQGALLGIAKTLYQPQGQQVAGTGGVREARLNFQSYAAKNGIQVDNNFVYAPVDVNVGMAIADAFDKLKHNPKNKNVKKSYAAFAKETKAQYEHLVASGVKFEPWTQEGQPYANSSEMLADVDKGHLWFFLGGDIPADSPIAKDSGITINGKPLSNNDVFRCVHDYFGHAVEGLQFGPRGEYNATRAHAQLYSEEAIPAMLSETLGQNSWVNFGKHLRNADGKVIQKGEEGYVPVTERPYAEQKAALLPDGVLPEEFRRQPKHNLDVQAELQRIALQGGTPTDEALVAMLAMKPEYIPNVAAYLLKQREKLLAGKMSPRDVAKALILTRASIGAGEIDLTTSDATFDAAGLPDSLKGSNDIGNMPASNFQTISGDKSMIRPEDQMAKFLFTPQGQELLDHLEQVAKGKVELDRSLFDKNGQIAAARIRYGRVSTITDLAKESGKTKVTKYNLDNLGELTKAINEAGKSGDMEALSKVLMEIDGIGTGKVGFISQLLGFGGESTIDTVEISTWLFGKKQMPSDPEGQALHRYASSKEAAPIVKKMVKEGFARLAASPGIAAQLTAAEMDPNTFETIFHHWFWDRAKGTETSHKGLYDAMELAQKLLGSQHVAGRVLGYTRINAMQPSTIGLFQGANPATLLHEDAHGFRRFMNAEDTKISTDWVEQVTGVKVVNGEWQVAHEEAFARGFEQWLLEGRLPADAPRALKGVFQRLKQLVLDSYRESVNFQNKGTVDDFVGPLTDPMRGVFERMIGYRSDPMNATEQAIHNNLIAQNQEAIGRDVVPTTQAQADARDMMLSYCRWDFRRMPIADQRALLQEIFEVQRDRIEPLEADTVLGPVFGSRLREFKPSKMPANGMAALQRRLTKRLREASGRADGNARVLAAHIPADAVTIVEIDRFAQHAFNAMYPHQRVAKRRSAFLRYAAVYHPEYILNLNRARATLAGLNINDVKWRGREARLRELVANAPSRPMDATMPVRRGSTTLNSRTTLTLTHYSTTAGLEVLDPNKQGTGARSPRSEQNSTVRRTYFYVAGTDPERLVVKNPKIKYRYNTVLTSDQRLYDMATDPDGIIADSIKDNDGIANQDMYLTAIKEAGYAGYHNSKAGSLSNVVALFNPQSVEEADFESGKPLKSQLLYSQTPMNVPANTEAEEALQKVLDYFGTTENIKEAGMLHPNGAAIALFKTGFGMHTERLVQSGVDNLSLQDFITETGAARISSDGYYLNVETGAPLTRAQAEALEDQAYSHREVRVDFHKIVEGEWPSFEHVVVERDDAGKLLGKLRRAEREAFGHREGYRVLYSANPPVTNPDDIIAAAEELAAEFERVERASMVSIIGDIRKSMMLTSPKTHLRNIVGNLGFQAAEEFSRFPAVMFDVLASLRYGQRSITANQLDTAKAVIHTFTNRDGSTLADKGGITRAFEEIMGVGTTNTQTTDNHHGWNRDNRAVQILEKINNITFKALAAEDALFNTFALRRALLDMARVAVKNKEVASQADYMNSLTDDQIQLAYADALFATFNNTNKVSTFISGLKKMMSEDPDLLSQSGRLVLDMIVPFDRTPMNILARIVDYTPVGFALGSGGRKETEYLIGRRREEEGGEPNGGGIPIRSSLTGKISQAEAIRAKKELMTAFDRHDLQMLQKEMAKQTGRGIVGTIIIIGAALGAKGLLRGFYGDDEDEWIESWGDSYRIKAFGQSDDTLRNDTDNSQRNSINIGGKWYSIDSLAPIGPLLILGATIRESMNRGDTYSETGSTFLVEAARQVASMPVVRGFTDLGKASEDAEDKGPRFLGRMVTSFIPSVIRDMADFMDDKEREVKGVAANIKMAIPGAYGRESLPVRRDFLGRELPQKGGLEAIFDLFRSRESRSSGLDTGSVGKTADKDPVFRELDKWDITLTKPAQEEGESEEDYNVRVTVVGNAVYRALQAEVQAERYKAMAGLRDAKGQNKQKEQLKDVMETAKSRASSHLARILKERGKVKPPEPVEYPKQEAKAKEAAEAAQRKAEAAAKKAGQFPSMDFDLSAKPKKPKLPRPKTLEGLDSPATPQGPGTPIDFGKQEYEDGDQ